MLNFREELGKIKSEKLHRDIIAEAEAEKFLKAILSKFKEKSLSDLFMERQVAFELLGTGIIVREISGSVRFSSIAKFNSEKIATMVFMIAEETFQNEGYTVRISSSTKFTVYIKP